MIITSLKYFIFLGTGGVLYYIIPRRFQWIYLLLLSVCFYCLAATPYTIVFICITTAISYNATNIIIKNSKLEGVVIFCSIALNVLLWIYLKAWNLVSAPIGIVATTLNIKFSALPSHVNIASAMGMGYYTTQAIGYILDCKWGKVEPQKNPLKLLLFLMYFPQLSTGPISRYGDMSQLFEPHYFKYNNLTYGTQRILWGMLKKLVLADRLILLINIIWADTETWSGLYIWIAILLAPLQMYADFSGCVDIILGTSEIFDVKLVENFENPFFARNIQEFFQRWHITLGIWSKDYVLFPILKSKWLDKIRETAAKVIGKKKAKMLVTSIAMLICWTFIGLWHGAWHYVYSICLIFCICLICGESTRKFTVPFCEKHGFKTDSFSWHLFQSIRTYLIIAFGIIFFSSFSDGISKLSQALFVLESEEIWNPWIFFDGSIYNIGINKIEMDAMFFSVILLFIVAVLREKYGYARTWVSKQIFPFRWIIWIGMFLFVVIFGVYGPGYTANEFIYQGF